MDNTYSAAPATDKHVTAPVAASLLTDWFPLRDELCDLRAKPDPSDADDQRIWTLLNELLDIADDIVAGFAPDLVARCRITGENPADVIAQS